MTYKDIADELNRRRVPTAYRGGRWREKRIGEIIRRARKADPSIEDSRPPGPPRPPRKNIELPTDLVDRARGGDLEAVRRLREILGIREETWSALQIKMRATNAREEVGYVATESEMERMLDDCILAQELRMSGNAKSCLEILDYWLQAVGDVPVARADLQRRRCRPLFQLGFRRESLSAAREAVEIYRAIGWPGLDLYDSGLGDALSALGEIYGSSGRHSEAIQTFRRALISVDATVAPDLHGYVVSALAIDLAAAGKCLSEARDDLATVRRRFFRKQGIRSTYHMARLDWLEGSLMWRTSNHNLHRARDMVRRGRDLFTELEVPLDAACCAVDVEMMWRPEHRLEAIKDLINWYERARPILPAEVDGGIQEIRKALMKPNIKEPFRGVVWRVRNAIGKLGSVLPSFVCRKKDLASEKLIDG